MSRIEEALEKAARLRSSTDNAVSARKTVLPSPAHIPPPAATEGMKVANPLLVAASDPYTPEAEEYRKLKSALVKLTKEGSFRNMLMITSSVSCEGKSITALNLALTLAREYDHTVLLVDADLRKPSLHGYLGIEQRVGLSECLQEGLDLKDALIRTGIGKLSLLPAGREMRNPAEIFSSQKARELFLEIKHRYPDRYIEQGEQPELRAICGLDVAGMMPGIAGFENRLTPDLYRHELAGYHLSKYMLKFMAEGKKIYFVHYRKR